MGTSLVVQWLRLYASTAGSTGSVPGWGTKIPHAARWGQKKKVKRNDEINFNNKTLIPNIIFQYEIMIKLLTRYFTFLFFFFLVFDIQCVYYTFSTSQFRLSIFQVLKSHTCPVATVLESSALMFEG